MDEDGEGRRKRREDKEIREQLFADEDSLDAHADHDRAVRIVKAPERHGQHYDLFTTHVTHLRSDEEV